MTTLIVGQGLAGSILAIYLIKAGEKVLVIDNGHQESASRVAAGLMDYISGQRLTKSWNSDILIPFAKQFYQDLEHELNDRFFYERPCLRYFSSEDQVHFYNKRLTHPEFTPYLTHSPPPLLFENLFNNHFGSCLVNETSFLNTPTFLKACTLFLKEHHSFLNDAFEYNLLQVLDEGLLYKGISADRVLFCEGYNICKNPYFKDLDFRFAKGDVLTLDIPNLPTTHIINKDKWLVPFHTQFRFGATYEWNTINCISDKRGRDELERALSTWLTLNYRIVEHKAGVRTAAKDIRPVIGFHPDFKSIGIFNGFSSKGVMSIPYFAYEFSRFIRYSQTTLPDDIDCRRLFLNKTS